MHPMALRPGLRLAAEVTLNSKAPAKVRGRYIFEQTM
jgi:hypothetical protein